MFVPIIGVPGIVKIAETFIVGNEEGEDERDDDVLVYVNGDDEDKGDEDKNISTRNYSRVLIFKLYLDNHLQIVSRSYQLY